MPKLTLSGKGFWDLNPFLKKGLISNPQPTGPKPDALTVTLAFFR
jgi:hypothetical protein